MEAPVPRDGAETFTAMDVQKVEMGTSVLDKQVQQEAEQPKAENIPTPKDVDGCRALGGQMNPPIMTNVKVACDEVIKEGSVTIEKQEAKGKGCEKKKTITVSDEEATPPCFHSTKCPLTMSRQ
ncbi:unnamed protein product [Prunus armeniaca]